MACRLALLNVLTSLMAAVAVGVPALRQDVPAESVAISAIVVAAVVATLQGVAALAWWVLSDRAQARQDAVSGSSNRSVRHLAAPPE